MPPKVVQCDSATGNVYFGGKLLSEAMGKYVAYLTQGKAHYCATAQEDNAIMAAAARAHVAGKVDYFRFMVLRTISDFDRGAPGKNSYQSFIENNLNYITG